LGVPNPFASWSCRVLCEGVLAAAETFRVAVSLGIPFRDTGSAAWRGAFEPRLLCVCGAQAAAAEEDAFHHAHVSID
jgi:hypothetical protein